MAASLCGNRTGERREHAFRFDDENAKNLRAASTKAVTGTTARKLLSFPVCFEKRLSSASLLVCFSSCIRLLKGYVVCERDLPPAGTFLNGQR